MAYCNKECPLYCKHQQGCSVMNVPCGAVTPEQCDLVRKGYERGTQHKHKHGWGLAAIIHLVGHLVFHLVLHVIIEHLV